VRNASLWCALLGVENTVVEDVEFDDEAQVLVAHVRPRRASRGRCGTCGSRAPWYDRGQGRRRWRGLDMGTIQVVVEGDAPRVNCPAHGPTVRQVPWARHGAGHTRCFDQQVAWLATQCSKSAVTELMRIAWRTVGSIIARVWADTAAGFDAFAGLQRIGIDEISYKRHHKYLTVVVDHDSGRLVWAHRPCPDASSASKKACTVARSRPGLAHPHGLRLRQPRPPHRPGNAHPRRTPPSPPRPTMTHGSVTRASFGDAVDTHADALSRHRREEGHGSTIGGTASAGDRRITGHRC
jgi:hypothetical protein